MITDNTILTASIHQNNCTHYISLQKNTRIFNRAIHMGFSRKIHYNIRPFFLKKHFNC